MRFFYYAFFFCVTIIFFIIHQKDAKRKRPLRAENASLKSMRTLTARQHPRPDDPPGSSAAASQRITLSDSPAPVP